MFGFAVLPPATTYKRIWRARKAVLKPFNPSDYQGEWSVADNRTYRGFIHIIDPYPRRFTCSGGVYTEIPAFNTVAATKGQKAEINTAYETAPHEELVIFDPQVYTSLIPRPIGTVAPFLIIGRLALSSDFNSM
jgi:hypothetical protein